jgi:hypothetical protein
MAPPSKVTLLISSFQPVIAIAFDKTIEGKAPVDQLILTEDQRKVDNRAVEAEVTLLPGRRILILR